MSVFVDWASAWNRTSTPAFVSDICIIVILGLSSCAAVYGQFFSHLNRAIIWLLTLHWVCLALYGRELEEEEEEEDEEDEQLEVHTLPDLLFRKAPQLLQYTAALHSRYGTDDDEDFSDGEKELEIQRERRGELRLDSNIGTVKSVSDDTMMYEI